ncbi:MAG: phage holin family protein [Oxalobacteraceae bacterium]|nr:phage holin family protein [Oxalobacteraceae bacterium]
MAIVASASRLAGTLIGLLQTRLELATVELEEETLRIFSYLLFALVAMCCVGMTILLSTLLIVVIFWDTHRIGVLVALIATFGLGGGLIMLAIRNNYRSKPKMLSHTLSELSKDVERLNSAQSGDGASQ